MYRIETIAPVESREPIEDPTEEEFKEWCGEQGGEFSYTHRANKGFACDFGDGETTAMYGRNNPKKWEWDTSHLDTLDPSPREFGQWCQEHSGDFVDNSPEIDGKIFKCKFDNLTVKFTNGKIDPEHPHDTSPKISISPLDRLSFSEVKPSTRLGKKMAILEQGVGYHVYEFRDGEAKLSKTIPRYSEETPDF